MIGRHAYGDLYRGLEMVVDKPGRVDLVYTPEGGLECRLPVHQFKGPGVVMGSTIWKNRFAPSPSHVSTMLSERRWMFVFR